MDNRENIKIFIGSGEASLVERKTLIYSLHKHTKRKLDIYVFNGTHNALEHNQDEPVLAPLPLKLKYLNGSTEFSLYRYLIPQICQYRGKAIYLDADIVCLADIGELWDAELKEVDLLALANAFPELGQGLYRTSVTLMNCESWRLDLDTIFSQIDRGLYAYYPDFFHLGPPFRTHHPYRIGELDPRWNSLDCWNQETKAIHYTNLAMQPWKYHNHPYGELWFQYFREALASGYITREDIQLSIERACVRRDILDGNFWHKCLVKKFGRTLGQLATKFKAVLAKSEAKRREQSPLG
jgi:lipopolysaccharide biosynthesis glycosyltransferase